MKTVILDTNVLIHNPEAPFAFKGDEVIIPLVVIEELDDQKGRQDEVGRNARRAARLLYELSLKGRLDDGIHLEGGGILRAGVQFSDVEIPLGLDTKKIDTHILGVALGLKGEGRDVLLVTKDIILRIKARSMGIPSTDYEPDRVSLDTLYTGVGREGEEGFYPNQFILKEDGLYMYKKGEVVKVSPPKIPIWGIEPKNQEQMMALILLLNDDIQIVTLAGPAGSGKTLLSLACGLVKVVEEKLYETMYITRPFPPRLDKDMVSNRWISPVMDNLTLLFSKYKGSFGDIELGDLMRDGVVEIEPLIYTRGRSIPRRFIIVDDAQNLTPNQVKGILVQIGARTKVVLAGNPYDVDNPYLEPESNGLLYAIERLKTHELSGHITLIKGERSGLVESIDMNW